VVFCSRTAFIQHKPVFDEVGSVEHYILYGDQAQDGAILFKDFLTETVALEDFEPVPVNGWEDTAFIVYSSGTTGLPKGQGTPVGSYDHNGTDQVSQPG
ncbi:hypothetical protein HF086_016095, partial [Spodoptera exigua]